MEFQEINPKLIQAIQQVLEHDRYLLEHDINEPSISHRLAVYLEPQFSDFNVDCEYNGNIDVDSGRKYLNILRERAEQLGLIDENVYEQEMIFRCVYPDIIVHKRGQNGRENNLLIIEVKKSSNPDDGVWDIEKLSRFTSSDYDNNFEYQYGAFVRFIIDANPNFFVQWYQNGLVLYR